MRSVQIGGDAGVGIVDLGRPEKAWKKKLHRVGTSVVLPLAGRIIGAREEYSYLHRSLDRHPPPEVLFANGPLKLREHWRMGPFGFVYGALLVKE